jgi:tetratricopeptide (TPR) repeat protein
LARDPGAVGALQRLASSAVAREEWERAADLYGKLVRLLDLPEHDPAFGGLVVAFADACQRAGRAGDAREALELALARRPESGPVAWQLERTCEATGAWRRLSELLVARAHRMADPAKRERLLLRAAKVLADEAGAHAEALGLLERVCAEYPASIEASLASARALVAVARPSEGLALLEPALARATASSASAALRAEILLETGKAYLALGQPLEAFARLEAGFDCHTRNRELAMLLGVVAHDLGDQPTAERALKIAFDLSSREDGGRGDLAAVDARVATRILSSIARARDEQSSAPPRMASGIEIKRGAAAARIEPPVEAPERQRYGRRTRRSRS